MKLGHFIVPFTVGLNRLRVAFKGMFCDGADKLLTFSSVRTEDVERRSVCCHFAGCPSG
jgi:hypothetical protein